MVGLEHPTFSIERQRRNHFTSVFLRVVFSFFLRLEGSQCHAPPQGETGYGKMDDISLLVGPALRRTGGLKKKDQS